MENEDENLNNQINELIQLFFKAPTINDAKGNLIKIKEKLNYLKNFYSTQNNEALVRFTSARIEIWDAYEIYIDAKNELAKTNISDERGQFMIAFQRGAIMLQSKKTKFLITPQDLFNRIKVASEFMKIARLIQEAPDKTYKAVKEVYNLIKDIKDQETIKSGVLFLKNWVNLMIQWKLEILSLGVIIGILKGDWSEFKKLVDKHVELISQLDALYQGQKYQKIRIIDDQMFGGLNNVLSAKYHDLTARKGGILGGGGTKDILTFINQAEPVQDIVIPTNVTNISFKELFPKELEK